MWLKRLILHRVLVVEADSCDFNRAASAVNNSMLPLPGLSSASGKPVPSHGANGRSPQCCLGQASGESVLFDGYRGGLNATNTALIYGDYHFTEALLRLQNMLDGKSGWVLYSPAVPESSTWAMMLLGFAGLGFACYRASRRTAAAA